MVVTKAWELVITSTLPFIRQDEVSTIASMQSENRKEL